MVLVGGASRRFGSPKALASFEGETLAERAWRTIGRACDIRIAVGKHDELELPFPILDDGADDVRAALAGVVAGLRATATEIVVVLPVDLPLVRADDLRALADACDDAAVPQTGPLPCALRRTTLPILERALAGRELALRAAFAPLATRVVALDPAVLANVNTREDLLALQLRIVPFRPEHAAGFRALVADTLREYSFEPDQGLDPDLADPTMVYEAVWVALAGDEVVGSVALRRVGTTEVELKRMYLRPGLRGRGAGRKLLEMAIAWAQKHRIDRIALDTTEAMQAARRLYEANGFVQIGGAIPRQGQARLLYELRL
jgi:molybdopterin-guanine dinucleotide biosynthesis protein A/RimJ/RimL family protein N-acetyltransferase